MMILKELFQKYANFMNNIAIIPARGGSKRIPRKNIRNFLGKPIIAYSIEVAIESNLFDDIIVSTDDLEIAKIAKDYGAQVPFFRSEINSSDFASTFDVIEEVINEEHLKNKVYENICCIYPATPLIRSSYLSKGYELLINGSWNYVFSAVKVNSPPERYFELDSNRKVEMLNPEYEILRSQDFTTKYHDAGQFYWGKKYAWATEIPILSGGSTILELEMDQAIDMDNLEDWYYAEKLFKLNRGDS